MVLCRGSLRRWTGRTKGYVVGNEIWERGEHGSSQALWAIIHRDLRSSATWDGVPLQGFDRGVSCFHFHSRRASVLLHCKQAVKGARVEAEKPFRSPNRTAEKCRRLWSDGRWGRDEKAYSEYTLKAGLLRAADGLVEACEKEEKVCHSRMSPTHIMSGTQCRQSTELMGDGLNKQGIRRMTQSSLDSHSTTWGKHRCSVSTKVPAEKACLSQQAGCEIQSSERERDLTLDPTACLLFTGQPKRGEGMHSELEC